MFSLLHDGSERPKVMKEDEMPSYSTTNGLVRIPKESTFAFAQYVVTPSMFQLRKLW